MRSADVQQQMVEATVELAKATAEIQALTAERDALRAERDAPAAERASAQQAAHAEAMASAERSVRAALLVVDNASWPELAAHDARIRAAALEEAAQLLDRVPGFVAGVEGGRWLTEMAKDIRALANAEKVGSR